MSNDPTKATKQPPSPLANGEAAHPVCPYCGMDPLQFRTGITRMMEGEVVFYAFCINRHCRKLLPLCMIGMEKPRVVTPGQARVAGLN
jgi:hypothetical protein